MKKFYNYEQRQQYYRSEAWLQENYPSYMPEINDMLKLQNIK